MITFDSGIETTILLYETEALSDSHNMRWPQIWNIIFVPKFHHLHHLLRLFSFLPTISVVITFDFFQKIRKGDIGANKGFFIYVFNTYIFFQKKISKEKGKGYCSHLKKKQNF